MSAIGFKYSQSKKSRNPIGGGISQALSSENHDAAVAYCYDGYNQRAHEEVSMTMRSAMTGTEGNDADPKIAYGFSHSNSNTSMQTKPSEELGMTLRSVPTGEGATIQTSVAFLPTNSANAQSIGAEDELSPTLAKGGGESGNKPSVAIGFKAGQSADGGLGDEREVSPTLSHKPSALEPTLAQDNGVKCLNPQDQQTGRVYDPNGAMTSLQAGGGVSGMRRESVLMADSLSQMRYIVRRLTPTEAERLMGLPDGYTIPIGLEVTDELVAEFQRIHDTFNAIMAEYERRPAPKPKSANQVRAWLEKITDPDTCPDSPRYKACGNGWATNQPRWILTRLLAIGEGIDPFTTPSSSGGCREAGAGASDNPTDTMGLSCGHAAAPAC